MTIPQNITSLAESRTVGLIKQRRSNRIEELQVQIERLKKRVRIAVIFGGDKRVQGAVINPTFNPRSWKSYETVANDIAVALKTLGFRHVQVIPEDMRIGERLRKERIDLAWLNSGGVQGYISMSHSAAILEMIGIPYIGHDPMIAGILDSKHIFKRMLKALDIPTAPFMTWSLAQGEFVPSSNDRFNRVFSNYSGPFIVKPVSGRASLNVNLVEDLSALPETVSDLCQATENHVLIETFLPGREFCVAVCGPVICRNNILQRRGLPFTFAAVERRLDDNEKIFVSMDIRPITSNRVNILDPNVDGDVIQRLEELANEVFQEMNLETLIRLDVRMDAEGNMFVLEANPKPDLKTPTPEKTSLVCTSLASYGMSYEDLILSLLADRLDLYLSQRRGSITNLAKLLE
ncbi:MAG: D-alanyl-alanine synthetase [Gammaproteobacteria bacterium]|nr:MAG: D-alanyl-alanine synthetase [Gammaproteobacteria bacterium]